MADLNREINVDCLTKSQFELRKVWIRKERATPLLMDLCAGVLKFPLTLLMHTKPIVRVPNRAVKLQLNGTSRGKLL